MLHRRTFLGLTAAAAATLLPRAPRPAAAAPARPPRTFLQIILRGGIDPVLATDPKHREQVAADVDVPYPDRAVIERGGRRFGPALGVLGALVDTLTVVRGVRIYSASHPAALRRLLELRGEVPGTERLTPGLTGVLDQALPARPIGCLRQLGGIEAGVGAVRDLGVRYERGSALQRLRRHARTGARMPRDPALDGLLRHLRAAAEPAKLDPPKLPAFIGLHTADETTALWSRFLYDLFFTLENDLASTILLYAPYSYWDTHQSNLSLQQGCWAIFGPVFEAILRGLRERRSPRGAPLADEVGVLVSSEIGRFPRLNRYAGGKDHFPEISCLLTGPGLARASIGQTDRMMAGTPLGDGRRARHLEIDDLGASILDWFGVPHRDRLGYTAPGVPGLLAPRGQTR
jgi:hypothetical protein